MSDSSRDSSEGFQGLFGSFKLPKFNRSGIFGLWKGGTERTPDRAKEAVRKPADSRVRAPPASSEVRDMGRYGFESFGVPDGQQIYISRNKETPLFYDDDMEFVPAESEEFRGFDEEPASMEQEEEIAEASFDDLFVEEEPETEDLLIIQSTEPETVVAEEAEPAEEAPVVAQDVSPEDLFADIMRGAPSVVDTQIGCFTDGVMKETAPAETVEMIESAEIAEDRVAREIETRIFDAEEPIVPEAPIVMESADTYSVSDEMDPEDGFSDVPDVFVPRIEDFEEESMQTWDVPEEACDSFVSYISMIPEEVSFAAAPVWDVTDETAEAFSSYLSSIPAEETLTVVPVWDVSEEASDAYVSYLASIPREVTFAPAWDISEETASMFADYVAIIPEEITFATVPAWEVSEETAEAYTSYLASIPREITFAPAWNVDDSTAAAFTDYIAMIPEEESFAAAPVWEVSEETAESFESYLAMIPKEVTFAPAWDVNDLAADAYVSYLASVPKEAPAVPAWDVGEETASAFASMFETKEEPVLQANIQVTAGLPRTVTVEALEATNEPQLVDDLMAAQSGETGTFMLTSGDAEVQIPVKDNTAINQENLHIDTAKKVVSYRFVFRDGRLQKIPVEVELKPETVMIENEPEAAESISDEPVSEVIALPAAATVKALPEARPEPKGEVTFSFGQSQKSYDSVGFYF
ncbi:hypothetical protein AUP07_0482 [methanogenic archaeon mixed culture ISO4-G1]|nr:hypothetical protein AUP07_0482 [methanogenic archaeon mixed culture ISO4-G1]